MSIFQNLDLGGKGINLFAIWAQGVGFKGKLAGNAYQAQSLYLLLEMVNEIETVGRQIRKQS